MSYQITTPSSTTSMYEKDPPNESQIEGINQTQPKNSIEIEKTKIVLQLQKDSDNFTTQHLEQQMEYDRETTIDDIYNKIEKEQHQKYLKALLYIPNNH